MSWADNYIAILQTGSEVVFRPRGNSMTPKINSGDQVTVRPCISPPVAGDIVLCRVSGNQYLHLVSAIQGDRFQISNNHGYINGWTTLEKIYGVVISIEHL